jgi:hypothetical protein
MRFCNRFSSFVTVLPKYGMDTNKKPAEENLHGPGLDDDMRELIYFNGWIV